MAATESTAATAATAIAEHAPGLAQSELAAAVEEETFGLPTHRTKLIEVARLSSNQVVNPATELKSELA